MSPQPRQWFAGVDDESILRLLDPLDEGKPDLAPAEIWRDYIRTVGRTPNGVWGGKLMWNQTPLLLRSRQGPARALRRRAARRDPRRHRHRSGPGARLPARRGVPGGVVLARGADPGLAGSARSACATPAPSTTPARSRTSSPCCASRRRAGGPGSTRRTSSRSKSRIRCCGAISPRSSARCSRRWASIHGWRRAPVLERQADQRSDEWVDRYRADAQREGLPT